MEVKLKVPALNKLVDYVASGIGSVAGSMLAPWKAQQQAKVKQIEAEAEANSLLILAKAQTEAREILVSQDSHLAVEVDITNVVNQRIQFQELKRQANIKAVASQAADLLGDTEVSDSEPDHDWTARFFNDAQDVSSEEMQSLWAKILAGEVKQAGSTSIQTLSILKNLDQATANLFRTFCSICICFGYGSEMISDARVCSLGDDAGQNALQAYGLNFGSLNRLNEHGLIISDYNSWFDYQWCTNSAADNQTHVICLPFRFQNRFWVLTPKDQRATKNKFRVSGVALTKSGQELSGVIELERMDKYSQELASFFQKNNFSMTEVEGNNSVIHTISN